MKKALSSKNFLPTVNCLNVCEVSGFSYTQKNRTILDFRCLFKELNYYFQKMRFSRPLACKQGQRHLGFLYLINKTGTAELLSLRNNKKVIVNMHCSLYCCIHSLCKPQSPIHCNGILHGKIYIVMILPKTTCCKPFHSFLHIENITHSSKKIIASLICKNLRNGMSCQYTVNLYAKYRSMHWHRSGSTSPDSDSIKKQKIRFH